MNIIVGIDETGTETQMSDGWCYFGITEDNLAGFNTEVDKVKSNHRITGFHAKKFRSEEDKAYEEFLKVIDKYINKSPISICSTYLYRKDWARNLEVFAERVFSSSTKLSSIENPDATRIAKKFLPPLMTLSSISKNIGNQIGLIAHFDSDDIKKQIDDYKLSFDSNIALTLRKTLSIVANKYRELHFPDSPVILTTDIQVINDAKSNLIQAADVIGNFSNSYIFHQLGNTSAKRIEKSQIFQNVFGKYLTGIDFTGAIKQNGANDLELIGDAAALPFIFGRC